MHKGLRLLISFLLGFAGFLFLNKEYQILDHDIPYFSVPYGKVRVDVINHASEPLKQVILKDQSIQNIAVGARKSILLEQTGESSYQLKVVFASGKELQGIECYIETGDFVREEVLGEKERWEGRNAGREEVRNLEIMKIRQKL